jgi:pterin-4a-carbinolamine dehydratase
VAVVLWAHSAGRRTEKDLILAARIDRLPVERK